MKNFINIFVSIAALILIVGCSNPMGPGVADTEPTDTESTDTESTDTGDSNDTDNSFGIDLNSGGANDPDSNWGITDETVAAAHGFSATVAAEIEASIGAGPSVSDINNWFSTHIVTPDPTDSVYPYDPVFEIDNRDDIPVLHVSLDDMWDSADGVFYIPEGNYDMLYAGSGVVVMQHLWLYYVQMNVYRLMGHSAHMALWFDADNTITDLAALETPAMSGQAMAGVQALIGIEIYDETNQLGSESFVYDGEPVRPWTVYGTFLGYGDSALIYNNDPNYSDFSNTHYSIWLYYDIADSSTESNRHNIVSGTPYNLVVIAKFGSFSEIGVETISDLGNYIISSETVDYVRSIYP